MLFYHGLVEKYACPVLERNFTLISHFKEHLKHIAGLRPLPVAALTKEGHKLKPGGRSVVVTFDDGHRNNLIAAELCAGYKIPWTLFLSTGGIGHDRALWATEVTLLLLYGNANSVEVFETMWSLRSWDDRLQSFRAILRRLKLLDAPLKNLALTSLRTQFPPEETGRLIKSFPSQQMLDWSEVTQLNREGIEIGSHGVDHELHHANQSESVRLRELLDSRKKIEEMLGHPCRSFAFPNGDHLATSPAELRRAGYELGFTTRPGPIMADADPMLLPREVPLNQPNPFTP